MRSLEIEWLVNTNSAPDELIKGNAGGKETTPSRARVDHVTVRDVAVIGSRNIRRSF